MGKSGVDMIIKFVSKKHLGNHKITFTWAYCMTLRLINLINILDGIKSQHLTELY